MRFTAHDVGAEWFDDNVPCTRACPVLTNAGRYVAAIAAGDDELAYRIARLPNPFPSICGRVCAAPCELACRRGAIDEPIADPRPQTVRVRAPRRGERPRRSRVATPSADAAARRENAWRSSAPGRGTRVRARPGDLRLSPRRVRGAGPSGRHDGARHPALPAPPGLLQARDPRDPRHGGGAPHRHSAWVATSALRSLKDDGLQRDLRGDRGMRARDLQIPGVDERRGPARGRLPPQREPRLPRRARRRRAGGRGGNVALDAARTALREIAASSCRMHPSMTQARDGIEATSTQALDVARVAKRLGATRVRVVSLENRAEMPGHQYE